MKSSRNSDGLGVRLRKLLGCICSEAEETLAQGVRVEPQDSGFLSVRQS